MTTLFETGVKVLLLIFLLSGFQALLRGFGMVGGGVIIHDMHVVNTVRPLHSEVSNEEIPDQISLVLQRGPFEIVLPFMYGASCVYFGVVTHMCGGEGLS